MELDAKKILERANKILVGMEGFSNIDILSPEVLAMLEAMVEAVNEEFEKQAELDTMGRETVSEITEHLNEINGVLDSIISRIANLESDQRKAEIDKVDKALETAMDYGSIDGSHHRTWVIDQMVRSLTGDEYGQFVKEHNDGEDGPDSYEWETGIAP